MKPFIALALILLFFLTTAQTSMTQSSPDQGALQALTLLLEHATPQELLQPHLSAAVMHVYESCTIESIRALYQSQLQARVGQEEALQALQTLFSTTLQAYKDTITHTLEELHQAQIKNGIITGLGAGTGFLLGSFLIGCGVVTNAISVRAANEENERKRRGYNAHALFNPDAGTMPSVPPSASADDATEIEMEVVDALVKNGDYAPIVPPQELSLRSYKKMELYSNSLHPEPVPGDTALITPQEFQNVYRTNKLESTKELAASIGIKGSVALTALGITGQFASILGAGAGIIRIGRLSKAIAELEHRPQALQQALGLPLTTPITAATPDEMQLIS
jgi:hypothetical protein